MIRRFNDSFPFGAAIKRLAFIGHVPHVQRPRRHRFLFPSLSPPAETGKSTKAHTLSATYGQGSHAVPTGRDISECTAAKHSPHTVEPVAETPDELFRIRALIARSISLAEIHCCGQCILERDLGDPRFSAKRPCERILFGYYSEIIKYTALYSSIEARAVGFFPSTNLIGGCHASSQLLNLQPAIS